MRDRIIRVLLGKTTMEAHDRGVRYLATELREAGMEVIYMNFLEPQAVVDTAVQEDVDVIGISSSVDGHLPVARVITQQLRALGMDDVLVIFGGVIPERDFAALRGMGVKAIFGPGSSAQAAIDFIRLHVRPGVSGAAG